MRKRLIRKKLTGLLLSFSLLAVATPGFAENRSGAITLTPFVGGYTFEHKKSDKGEAYQDLETSPIFGLRAGYNFTENWGAEATFGYILAENRKPNYPEADVYTFGIDALYHFNPKGTLVPYLAAGIGGMIHEYKPNSVGFYPEYNVNYGGGIKYFVTDNVALRGDVRHVFLPDDSLNNLVYTAGVTFQFGGVKPAVKAAATCPTAPACPPLVQAKDTTTPYVTLALPYNGSVDVPVQRRVRVAFNEAIDPATINSQTFILKQGDKSIPGRVVAPTDTTASFTQDGDLAPDTLYTGWVTTGVRDLAGNTMAKDYVWSFKTAATAKPVVEKKTIYISKLVMLEDEHFEFDRATLSPAGKELMRKNVQIMKDNPDLKVRIAGYASAAGSTEYNQALSERRADAVMAFMVNEGGIATARLDSIGYGETRPAEIEVNPADRESKAAKANRRVLFEIIDK